MVPIGNCRDPIGVFHLSLYDMSCSNFKSNSWRHPEQNKEPKSPSTDRGPLASAFLFSYSHIRHPATICYTIDVQYYLAVAVKTKSHKKITGMGAIGTLVARRKKDSRSVGRWVGRRSKAVTLPQASKQETCTLFMIGEGDPFSTRG